MKLTFIQPNLNEEKTFPNLAIASIISYIRHNSDHKVSLIDLTFNSKDWEEYLLGKLNIYRPDVIAFSLTSAEYIDSMEILYIIKHHYPNVKIIWGGVHPTLRPKECLKSNFIDVVCIGEGEETILEYLNNDLKPEGIKGLAYKDKVNSPRKLIEDLDILPFPDWSDYDMAAYFDNTYNHFPIMASRGCSYGCTYCSNHALKKKLKGKYCRVRSVDNILSEIRFQEKKYKFDYIFFYDDNLLIYPEWINEFCMKYSKWFYYPFNFNVRPDLITDENIRLLKEAHCFKVRMGIESGNQFIRKKVYKRNITDKQIYDAVNIIKKYGLQIRTNFIVGAPYDNKETIKDTLTMIKRINPDQVHVPLLWSLPETIMEDMLIKNGLVEREIKNPKPITVTKTFYLNESELKKAYKKVDRYRYIHYFKKAFNMKGLEFIKDLIMFFFYYKHKYGVSINNLTKYTLNKYQYEAIK